MQSALCPRYGTLMGLSLCVKEAQTALDSSEKAYTYVYPTGHRTAGHMSVYFRLGQQVTSQEACPRYVYIFPADSSLSLMT